MALIGLATQAAFVLALGSAGWEEGFATRYAPGIMHATAARRGMAVADCMASWDRAPLGSFVWVRSAGTGRTLACQITDISRPGSDRKRHMRVNLVELDYSSSAAICLDRDGPWRSCPVWVMRVIPDHSIR